MDKKLPKGKGLYVWNIVDMPSNWITEFMEMGLTWIAVKIANGISSSNRRRTAGGGWVDDILEPFVTKAKDEGLLVYGWQYVYCYSPEDEAEKAAERMKKFGLDGFIIDAEHQCYGKPLTADLYSKMLRELMPDIPIGLSTYRFPDQHSRFPYKKFLDICDFNAPQVYWNKGVAGKELRESYRQYEKIKSLPFIPAGRAYYGEGFPKPTTLETYDFLDTAQILGCPAAFFWSADALYHRLKPLPEIRRAIAEYEWIGTGEPIPPEDPPPTNHYREIILENLEFQIDDVLYENQAAVEMRLIKKE